MAHSSTIHFVASLAKHSFVRHPNGEMLKVCQWYSNQDKDWLWDKWWNVSFYIFVACTILGAVTCILMGISSSCWKLKKMDCRVLSYIFGILAILNIGPFLIYWKADICSNSTTMCDESQINCVETCEMGSGSWQLFACSFIWISTMVTTWSMDLKNKNSLEKDNASQSTDDEDEDEEDSSHVKDDENQVSEIIVAYGYDDDAIAIPKKHYVAKPEDTETNRHKI